MITLPSVGPERLTKREVEILHHVAHGKHNKEIAEALFVSVHTVEHHVSNILGKMGVTSRVKAALLAVELGIVVLVVENLQFS